MQGAEVVAPWPMRKATRASNSPGYGRRRNIRENAAADGVAQFAATACRRRPGEPASRPINRTTLWRHPVNLDFIPQPARAAGLGALMKGAGKLTRFIPIPQPTLLVGPGSSGRLGQAIAGFGHDKILIVTDAIIAKLGLLKQLTDALDGRRRAVRGVRRDHARRADPADRTRHRLLPPARLRRHRRLRRRLVDGCVQGHRRGHRHRQAAARTGRLPEVRPEQPGAASMPCPPPPAPAPK